MDLSPKYNILNYKRIGIKHENLTYTCILGYAKVFSRNT